MSFNEYAIYTEDLTKIYGQDVVGVAHLNLRVRDGEIYGLIGPNGSGKTTTLRIIAGLIRPTYGKAYIYGINVVENSLKARELINYLPEEAGAYSDLSGLDFIRFMLSIRLRGSQLERAIDEAVEISGLGNALKRPVRTYSKGMKRILALSVVLASRPRLLILDEPTSGLDVERSIQIRDLILRYNREYKTTVLISSHNMLEVEYLCDRVGILYRGKLLIEGEISRLKEDTDSRNLEEVFIKKVREIGS
ncbi:MAG: ABC transporter ATP-binding protein [Sulfolobales archaeon]